MDDAELRDGDRDRGIVEMDNRILEWNEQRVQVDLTLEQRRTSARAHCRMNTERERERRWEMVQNWILLEFASTDDDDESGDEAIAN